MPTSVTILFVRNLSLKVWKGQTAKIRATDPVKIRNHVIVNLCKNFSPQNVSSFISKISVIHNSLKDRNENCHIASVFKFAKNGAITMELLSHIFAAKLTSYFTFAWRKNKSSFMCWLETWKYKTFRILCEFLSKDNGPKTLKNIALNALELEIFVGKK